MPRSEGALRRLQASRMIAGTRPKLSPDRVAGLNVSLNRQLHLPVACSAAIDEADRPAPYRLPGDLTPLLFDRRLVFVGCERRSATAFRTGEFWGTLALPFPEVIMSGAGLAHPDSVSAAGPPGVARCAVRCCLPPFFARPA
ncbi:MAG: hypothetical protein EHM77_05530 [Planctomycetaceae bacterium]|nr:MAG: hypothetical protein EHM77_05530 [Planctomycetaceae bacterium]